MTNQLNSDIQIRERHTEDHDRQVFDILHDEHPMGWLYATDDGGPTWGWSRSDRKNAGREEGFWQALTALLETYGKHGKDRRYMDNPFRASPLHYRASDRILEVVEGGNGYYLYYNWGAKEWDTACIGDGVDFFTSEDGESLSPGTQPFNAAMMEWVESGGGEIVEAYFPDRADDYFTRKGVVTASERARLMLSVRNAVKRAGDTPVVGLGLIELVLPHLTMRALRQIVAKLEDDEE